MSDPLFDALQSAKPLGLKLAAKGNLAFKVNPDGIPPDLKAIPRWFVWKFDEKGNKTPRDFSTRKYATGTAGKDAWGTFDDAYAAYRDFEYDGISFGISGEDGIVGLDYDDSRHPDGAIEGWAGTLMDHVKAYTEISPSGTGTKSLCYAPGVKFPGGKDCVKLDGHGCPFEVYRAGRCFTITGHHVQAGESSPLALVDRTAEVQAVLDAVGKFEASKKPAPQPSRPSSGTHYGTSGPTRIDRAKAYLRKNPPAIEGSDGSGACFRAACIVAWGFGITNAGEFLAAMGDWNLTCEPPWSEKELLHKFDSAMKATNHQFAFEHLWNAERPYQSPGPIHRESSQSATATPSLPPVPMRTFRELAAEFPKLRPPILEGLLREGETMNIIASSKAGKSWLVTSLALSIITGRTWLGTFEPTPGDVLLIDNELHAETLANRIPKVAEAMGIVFEEYADNLRVINLRGYLRDFDGLGDQLNLLEPGRFKVIIFDAFYRFLPKGTDENDNGAMANIYNFLDYHASRLRCSFVCIHHASKGNQSAKAVTDVGSGAGSQSRAVDCHLVLRPHEEQNVVVLDAAVRSWKPIDAFCLKWGFPLWTPAPDLDPNDLLSTNARQRRTDKTDDKDAEQLPKKWTVDEFAVKFVSSQPTFEATIVGEATDAGIPRRKAEELLGRAIDKGLVHKWKVGNETARYATLPPLKPNAEDTDGAQKTQTGGERDNTPPHPPANCKEQSRGRKKKRKPLSPKPEPPIQGEATP